ncbi:MULTISPECIES: MobF family relaxase [Streptomyces]|uniref:MobF family relaxase n=1 Tax=Streptomyces TaxID=1883 RepID=UPI00186AD73B|nr:MULTISPECIES: MobF family relaxase [Streptomyces]
MISEDVELGRQEAGAYWSSGGDTPGYWLGRQATDLKLKGQVTEAGADAIFKDGVSPVDGAPLERTWPRYPTAEEHFDTLLAAEPHASDARRDQLREQTERMGNRTARSGWEMVCSPVKSFAVLWGTADDKTRERLEKVEREAFRKVFARLEREACWTRSGPGGVVQLPGSGLIAAGFEHRSSRAGDPDWHRHVAISAKVRTEDGRWLALDARHLHRLVVSLSAQYTAEIERGMHRELKVVAAPRADTVRSDKRPVREFLGVPATVIRAFSARRTQTERQLAQLVAEFRQVKGREPSRAEEYELAQRATLIARPDKQAHDREGEREEWRERARRLGVRRPERWLRRARKASRRFRSRSVPLKVVVERVLGTLESDRESWTRANVEAETYRQLAGRRPARGARRTRPVATRPLPPVGRSLVPRRRRHSSDRTHRATAGLRRHRTPPRLPVRPPALVPHHRPATRRVVHHLPGHRTGPGAGGHRCGAHGPDIRDRHPARLAGEVVRGILSAADRHLPPQVEGITTPTPASRAARSREPQYRRPPSRRDLETGLAGAYGDDQRGRRRPRAASPPAPSPTI